MTSKSRAGRTIPVGVRKGPHRVGMILAPYGMDEADSSYDDEGGDSASLVDGERLTVVDKLKSLHESLDAEIASARKYSEVFEDPSSSDAERRRELVGHVTNEFDSLLIVDPIKADEAVEAWADDVKGSHLGQMVAIEHEGRLALGAVVVSTDPPHWTFAVYSVRDLSGTLRKIAIEPVRPVLAV